jgi:DNA-directed RNA polymerase sigma subunit (sigma70/sigma32)
VGSKNPPADSSIHRLAVGGSAALQPKVVSTTLRQCGTRSRKTSGHDATSLYLKEIGAASLLTPAEEKMIARRIRQGDESARHQSWLDSRGQKI